MSPRRRFWAASAFLLAAGSSLAAVMSHRYGAKAGWRCQAGIGVLLLGQQSLVGLALGRHQSGSKAGKTHPLSLVDAFTLSRGGTAAVIGGLVTSGVRDRHGLAGWLGWLALIYGAIVSDWLDGPIARRFGTSEVGAMLDIEADSGLTLASSAAAVTWGSLPAYVIAPPLLRYLRLAALRRWVPYRALVSGDPLWTRHIGMAQMMLFIAALAPFGGRVTRQLVRIGTPTVVIAQLGSLAVLTGRKLIAVRGSHA